MTERDLIDKVPTGISGFDPVALGGLPAGRSTLVAGSTGSGKTVFAVEYLARGIARFQQPGVFVTFEESPVAIRRNAESLGFPIAQWENTHTWAFVDVSERAADEAVTVGLYNFAALVARIENTVRRIGATRVVLDSIGAVFARYPDVGAVRSELVRLCAALDRLGVTTVITSERPEEHDGVSKLGVEEFVLDNVVVLRNLLHQERRRRTIEVVKFRGAPHRCGEWLFTIAEEEGLVVIPLAFLEHRERASGLRVSSGNEGLDAMCGGGFYRDSIILLTGPTGSGKTLISLGFADAAFRAGQRCLFYSFDETRQQLGRSAAGWGFDLDAMEDAGLFRVEAEYAEVASLEDHFLRMRRAIAEWRPQRLIIDTVSALERIGPPRSLLDFLMALGTLLRQLEITSLVTSIPAHGTEAVRTPQVALELTGLTDVTIMLRHLEGPGEIQQAVSVIQTRGSAHDSAIRRVRIDDRGMHIGEPLPEISRVFVPGT